ncbi:hypothetical protein AFLA_014171 [Aspergillus flavus NRRL3357]|nr:hypothetical protein AFLA_014171 [Aspergillus flavus NRRL3357]
MCEALFELLSRIALHGQYQRDPYSHDHCKPQFKTLSASFVGRCYNKTIAFCPMKRLALTKLTPYPIPIGND